MIFRLLRTYDAGCLMESGECIDARNYIEINTLEELISLEKEVGDPLIISSNPNDENEIEIYDDYRE